MPVLQSKTVARAGIFLAIASCFAASPGCNPEPTAAADSPITISASAKLTVEPPAIADWVGRAQIAVTHFYGRFPVNHVLLIITSAADGAVQGGVEHDGNRINIRLGPQTTPTDLTNDWMLTHEMFHLSQPDLPDEYSWMSEGMADYLEPVARVRTGQITAERFWKDLIEGLPQGLPEPGDRGLDHTHTWGRTYWGGCLYWLLADIRVRQQTHNTRSVRDATKAALDAGGNGSQEWPLEKLLDTYDKGTGTTVFENLHNEMGNQPVSPDLNVLWKSLGVIYDGGQVTFDERAPLAAVRKSITAK